MLAELTARHQSIDRQVAELEGQAKLLLGQINQSTERAVESERNQAVYEEARVALEEMEKAWRRKFEERLSTLVSHGLTAVFGEETTVTIETEQKRAATHMTLKLTQGGVELGNIIEGTGGSIVSVLSVLLRVMLTVSVTPPLRRLIVLDEPLHGAVDPSNIPSFGTLIRELAAHLNIQFIIVAHEPELEEYADRVYLVERRGESPATIRCIKEENEERG